MMTSIINCLFRSNYSFKILPKSVNKSFIIQPRRADGARSGEKPSAMSPIGQWLLVKFKFLTVLTLEDNPNNRLQLTTMCQKFYLL